MPRRISSGGAFSYGQGPEMQKETIRREPTGHGERYVLVRDGVEAELTFNDLPGDKRVTDHTRVPEALGGQGVGTFLVERAVKDAREEGKTIVPQCWFVRQQIDRHPEWQDVL